MFSRLEGPRRSIETEVTLKQKEELLRQKFIKEATVADYEKGYISAPWVNQLIDPRLQGYAADLIREHFLKEQITKIVPIPTMGYPIGVAVSERLNIPLSPGRKGNNIPGAWKNPYVIKEETPSFTTGEKSSFIFNEIHPGDHILLVDDFCALGATGYTIANHFISKGIIVSYAVYCAKMFQGGFERIKNSGVSSFCAIGIEKITSEGAIFLSPPHFSR